MSVTRARLGLNIGPILNLLRGLSIPLSGGVMADSHPLPAHHRVSGVLWKTLTFDNPWGTWKEVGVSDILKWMSSRKAHHTAGHLIGNRKPTAADFAAAFPLHAVDWKALANPPSDAIQAVWAGHSTVLAQMQGLTFITDPVFSTRASPMQWAGPKRVTPPAFTLDAPEMPDLDFVLISHNHYDHLDIASVRALYRRYGTALRWYVPLGLRAWFSAEGITNVCELDWWEEAWHPCPDGSSVRVALTPAQHATLRGPVGPNSGKRRTLWGGWAVLGDTLRFWFAGDTGYCPVFKEIGDRLGPFDLSAIPTAAYEPRWFMESQHIDPRQAVAVHKDVRSARSMAVHLATFPLTDEPMDEPVGLLQQEAKAAGLAPEAFVTLQHGASIVTARGQDHTEPATL